MVQLFVQTVSEGTRVLRLRESSPSIGVLRSHVAALEGLPQESVRISFKGKELVDSDGSVDLANNDTLFAALRLLGGGKKRKKKTYTTPKKIKHKKKKVSLAVLKYYKVDDDGQITRLRRECPNEECGAGVFMAAHKDRQYCGRCGLTYVEEK